MSLSQSVLVGLHLSAVVAIDIHTGRDLLQLNELYLSNHDLENKLLALLLFDRLIVYDLSVSPPALYHCSIGEGVRFFFIFEGNMNDLLMILVGS